MNDITEERNKIKNAFKNGEITIKKAIELMRKLYKKTQDPFTKFELGNLYAADKNTEKAKEIFKELAYSGKYVHITKLVESSKINLSKLEMRDRDYDSAKSHISDVTFENQSSANQLNARIERKSGSYESARQKYMLLIQKEKNPDLVYELGVLEYKNGNIDGVKQCIEMLKTLKDEVQILRLQIILDMYNGDRESTKMNLHKLIGTRFDHDAKLMLGTMIFVEGNNQLALEYFESLLDTKSRLFAIAKIAKIKDDEGFHEEAHNDYALVVDKINDDRVYIDYASNLCYLGMFDQALIYLDKVNDTDDKKSALFKKIFILIYLNRFEEAMQLFKDNFKLSDYAYGLPWFYTVVNLFPRKEIDIESLSYSCKQCYKYKAKRAINHIKEHLIEEDTGEIHTLFYEDVDVENLYFDIRERIHDMKYHSKDFSEVYIINAGFKVGKVHGYETEYVKVVTIPGTKGILTIYPVVVTDRFRELDRDQKS